MSWTPGNNSGSQILTDDDDLYAAHVNELRQSLPTSATVGVSSNCEYYCDGTADDVELNAALAAIGAAGGGIVFVRAGLYNLNAALSLPSNVALVGEGYATHLKLVTNASIQVINNADQVGGNSNMLIANLRLDGNKSGITGSQNGIFFVSAADSLIENVYVQNFRVTGINIQTSSRVVVRNTVSTGNTAIGILFTIGCSECVMQNCKGISNSSFGLQFKDADYCVMTGCVAQGNGEHGLYVFDSAAAGTGSNNTITGNTSRGNSKNGIYINAGVQSVISDNVCYGNTWSGIAVDSGCNNTTITGNTCNANQIHGIGIAGVGHSVTGNTSTLNQQHGIVLLGCTYNSVTGNTSINNSQGSANTKDGIHLAVSGSNSTYNVLTGNVCSDTQGGHTQRYGIRENSSSENSNLITSNIAKGNTTGQVSTQGAATVTANNIVT